MSNRDRVLALIRERPGLTDREIRELTGVEPHQQINQICRLLASEGLIRRTTDPAGRIVNAPVTSGPPTEQFSPATAVAIAHDPMGPAALKPGITRNGISTFRLNQTMFVVACSASKRVGPAASLGSSVLNALPFSLAEELHQARKANARTANVDETTVLPAIDRYSGHMYQAGAAALATLAEGGARCLIVSGGYGVVLHDEAIGMYSCVFNPRIWPNRIIERSLAALAASEPITTVIGVLSGSTNYAKVFRRTPWTANLTNVILASPERTLGAMVKAPRAQGEAVATLAQLGKLPANWRSSDGVGMEVTHHIPC